MEPESVLLKTVFCSNWMRYIAEEQHSFQRTLNTFTPWTKRSPANQHNSKQVVSNFLTLSSPDLSDINETK